MVLIMSPPPTRGRHIVFGSIVVVVVCIVIWTSSKPGDLDLDLQGQIGLETFKLWFLIFFKFNHLEFYLQTGTVY